MIELGDTCGWLLESHHDSIQGIHVGSAKLIYSLSRRYYWPTMNRDSVGYVDSCERCQLFKIGKAVGRVPVGKVAEPESGMMDICGPLKRTGSGSQYILCLIEYSSRFVRLIPMADCKAKTTAMSFFDHWLCMFGPPRAINSDRGPAFISLLMRELCGHYDVGRKLSCPYVPRSHGIVERAQLTIQRGLGYYLERYEDDWDIPLQAVALAMNSTSSKSTGFSPNLLTFGREVGKVVDAALHARPRLNVVIRRSRRTAKGTVAGY